MNNSADKSKKFNVVQFIALPFEGIDDYVCVPKDWVVIRRTKNQKVVVAYPKDEDRFVTRERVKKEERYIDDWKFWTAELKYQSDTFEDADFWIATRNDYGPLVQQNSSLNETPSTSTLNKKLRSSKQKSTSKSKQNTPEMTQKPYQIPRKPLPKTTIKRPAFDESQSQLETKRVRQSTVKADEPTGVVSHSANGEPRFSSMPKIIEDRPLSIDIDEDDHSQQDQQSSNNNNSENQPVNDMTTAQNHLQDNGNSSSNFQPQIISVKSRATTSNNQEPRAGDSSDNRPPSPQHEPESIETRLYEKMKGKPSLVATGPAVEKKIRLQNIKKNVAILLKNPPNSMNQNHPSRETTILSTNRNNQFIHPGEKQVSSHGIQHVGRISIERIHNGFENPRVVLDNVANVVSAPQNLPSSPQQRATFACQLDRQLNSPAPDQHMQQTMRGQNLPQRSTEAQRRDPRFHSEHRPISAAINTEHPHIARPVPVVAPSNEIDRSPRCTNASERIQAILNQRSIHLPKYLYKKRRFADATLPRSSRRTPLPQEALREPSSPLFSNLPDSMQRKLLATHSHILSRQEEMQGNLAQGTPRIETHPDAWNSAVPVYGYQNPRRQAQTVDHSNERNQVYFQNDIDRPPSAPDSGFDMDHDAISDHEIPTEEEDNVDETTNNINRSQDNSRFIPQQQMKDQFASVATQMGSNLNYMVNVFETLRTSILETAASYQTLLNNLERFNSPENSASLASMSMNVAQEVPLIAEEREIATNSGANFNGDRERNNVVNKAPGRNPNSPSWFSLPPEYDPNDTKWTLKYYEHMPGLVELMPHSNIYVSYGELKYIEETSFDCPTLARRILLEVFTKNALSVCLSMTEKEQDHSIYPDETPKLNEHGCLVLLNYVLSHGIKRHWKTDLQPILRGLDDTVREIRFKFGVMSRC